MSYSLKFQIDGDYLRSDYSGDFPTPNNIGEIALRVKEKALEAGLFKILVDCRGSARPKSEFDKFVGGTKMAKLFPPPFKLAFIFKKEVITKLGENAAVNRGAVLLVCADEKEAVNWLLAKK